jgi:hypothetical protein
MQTDPTNTTIGDLVTAALRDCGALGVGQTALASDANDAWARLEWMLQAWQRKRYLVYHLVTLLFTSTGALTYTVGPGQNFDTGAGSNRPDKLEAAFLRQITQSQPNQIDYPLELLNSMEDYSKIALKQLVSFPGSVFYDPAWPNGVLYVWPVPNPAIYAVGIVVKEQLPNSFPNLAAVINLPYEYYRAIVANLALALRPKYGIPTMPGDMLTIIAADSLSVLRGANAAIPRLSMPSVLTRRGQYNIFSDRSY